MEIILTMSGSVVVFLRQVCKDWHKKIKPVSVYHWLNDFFSNRPCRIELFKLVQQQWFYGFKSPIKQGCILPDNLLELSFLSEDLDIVKYIWEVRPNISINAENIRNLEILYWLTDSDYIKRYLAKISAKIKWFASKRTLPEIANYLYISNEIDTDDQLKVQFYNNCDKYLNFDSYWLSRGIFMECIWKYATYEKFVEFYDEHGHLFHGEYPPANFYTKYRDLLKKSQYFNNKGNNININQYFCSNINSKDMLDLFEWAYGTKHAMIYSENSTSFEVLQWRKERGYGLKWISVKSVEKLLWCLSNLTQERFIRIARKNEIRVTNPHVAKILIDYVKKLPRLTRLNIVFCNSICLRVLFENWHSDAHIYYHVDVSFRTYNKSQNNVLLLHKLLLTNIAKDEKTFIIRNLLSSRI